jgi:hypothetical protein
VWAGEHKVPIKGYGTVDVLTKTPNKDQELTDKILRIRDVAFYLNFATNPVSPQQLHKRGLWWDNRPGFNHLRCIDFSVVAVLEKHYNQFVLEYIPKNLSKEPFIFMGTMGTIRVSLPILAH